MGSINLLWVASGTVGLLIGWLLRGSYSGQALRGAQIRAAQAESLAVRLLKNFHGKALSTAQERGYSNSRSQDDNRLICWKSAIWS